MHAHARSPCTHACSSVRVRHLQAHSKRGCGTMALPHHSTQSAGEQQQQQQARRRALLLSVAAAALPMAMAAGPASVAALPLAPLGPSGAGPAGAAPKLTGLGVEEVRVGLWAGRTFASHDGEPRGRVYTRIQTSH
jgi:hypothetical protein